MVPCCRFNRSGSTVYLLSRGVQEPRDKSAMSTSIMKRLLERDDAATAVEYALLAASVAAVIAGTVLILGEKVAALFASVQF